MVKVKKPPVRVIKDIGALLFLMIDETEEYVTKAGKGFLDGLIAADFSCEVVTIEKYKSLQKELEESNKNRMELVEEKNEWFSHFLMQKFIYCRLKKTYKKLVTKDSFINKIKNLFRCKKKNG